MRYASFHGESILSGLLPLAPVGIWYKALLSTATYDFEQSYTTSTP